MQGAQVTELETGAHFDGPAYEPAVDHARLTGQILRVWQCMDDKRWRSLSEIARLTRDPESSVSAQLRHLRKPKFGSHQVNRRRRGDRAAGLFEYQVIPHQPSRPAQEELF